jgi:hypothetical protein
MVAHWKVVFETRTDIFNHAKIVVDLMVMIVTQVLHQVIKPPEALGTSVPFAMLAREFGLCRIEGFKMAIEYIQPGK